MSREQALDNPIFMIGSERSGTTLLRLMLDHHPKISFNPEFEYAVSQMGDDGSTPSMNKYIHFLETDFIFPGANFKIDRSLDYHSLVKSFLRQKIERDNKEIIGATVHHHFDRLLHIWPNARFIHLLRDPRDVARSVIGMGWAGNVWVGSGRWVDAELIWEEMRTKLTPERYTEVRYEDLIQDSDRVLADVCKFIGVEFTEEMYRYSQQSTYDKPDPSLVYQWRKKLNPEELGLVEARVGDLLQDRGYEPSGAPKIKPSAEDVARLEAESKAYCRKHRVKRYGLPLVVMAKISRMLPFTSLSDYFQLKMNKIDLQYIK